MRTLYHGSRVTVEQPEIRIQKFHKDFYWGFYCTEYEAQAVRWATRFGSGIVNVYRFDEQPGLSIKRAYTLPIVHTSGTAYLAAATLSNWPWGKSKCCCISSDTFSMGSQ